ncbi:uncharacterized protein TNCV_4845461 [Trichonephila clavipes]|uniref:Uncharacterized protein n=1 Tax=Trichonephila clavipes TaxID=2585209 RepID=A0A8X6WJJ6_TRICX|nr:uncharacterized protein TNCV_4845461 [Trichonephila clavipes]
MGEIDPIFRDSIEENPDLQVHKVAEGMELVLKKKYAFVYMTMVIKWYAATMGSNRFRRSKNTFSTEAIGIAIQKCHPCKRSFNHVVSRLEETGFFTKWYDDVFFKAKATAPIISVNKARPLALDDLQGSSPVPLKTRRVGQRCTLNLSRAETSSRWRGVVVRRGGASSGVVHVT